MSVVDRNNVGISGDGQKPMIFAHGVGCDQNMWRFVAPAFEADYKVVLFDHVGAGKSDLAAYEPEKYASLMNMPEICGELNLTDAVFVGHSVSAMIGVIASLEPLAGSAALFL